MRILSWPAEFAVRDQVAAPVIQDQVIQKEVSSEPGIASLGGNQQKVIEYDAQVVSTGKCELATTGLLYKWTGIYRCCS
jgi:hypothetical protein